MENLLSIQPPNHKEEENYVNSERALHLAMFFLIFAGVSILTGWASFSYIEDWVLKIGAAALIWGLTLLVLYLVFNKLEWRWWT